MQLDFKELMNILTDLHEREEMEELLKIGKLLMYDDKSSFKTIKRLIGHYYTSQTDERIVNRFYMNNEKLYQTLQVAFGKIMFPDLKKEEQDEKD